jgi:hypothetical protein
MIDRRPILGVLVLIGLATRAVAQPSQRSRADSIAAAKYVAKVYRQEAIFFFEWRQEWRKLRDLSGADPRFWSLHCHNDDYSEDDALHMIAYPRVSKKSMCPIWFQMNGFREDENLGIDNGIPPKARPKIREMRARILAMLDTANAIDPGNRWVEGQRVRLLIDQGEIEKAADVASSQCHISQAMCAMLEAHSMMVAGFKPAAEATYSNAVNHMTTAERCGYLDISYLLDLNTRDAYSELGCAQKAEIDERFWWLSDPLFIKPGNERLAEHLDRQVILATHSALVADEHFDYRPRYGGLSVAEMITRYGWPSVQFYDRTEDDNHNNWLGFKDSAANASREYFGPRYHLTPDYATAVDIRKLTGLDLRDVADPGDRGPFSAEWWPREHMQRAGPLRGVDYQAVAFRRERGPLVAVAADLRAKPIADSVRSRYTFGIVAMRNARDSARVSTSSLEVNRSGAAVGVSLPHPGLQVLSTEILDMDRDSSLALRARFAADLPPGLDSFTKDSIALSDIALYEAPPVDAALPKTMTEVIERLLPTTSLGKTIRVGVFFELYGAAAADSIDLTLTVIRQDQPSLFRRLGSRVGVMDPGVGSFVVHWRDGQPGNTMSSTMIGKTRVEGRSIILNLETLKSGHYALEIGASRGKTGVIARREFTIDR